ncbi:MAG: sigma 54-interacting transcriptional regulator [Candidatus Metalachnospira sp.]|nr:sigma 54-interacting transcriptional regulator [Candidatus Metalachnospira sp.]
MDLSDKIFFDLIKKGMNIYHGNILIADCKGNIIHIDKVLADAYGLTVKQALNMTVYDLVDKGIIDNSPCAKAIKEKRTVIAEVNVKNGICIKTTIKPLFDENGELEYVVGYSIDEGFIKELEQQVVEEKEKSNGIVEAFKFIQRSNNKYKSIVIADERMKRFYKAIPSIAATDSTIILYGESGSGKDMLANYIYANSLRKNEVFLPINCSAIPAELMEAELFGYEKGAFTGADKNGRKGIFETADKGTIFLDEIGDLSQKLQAKLLRFLDSGEIKRLGGNKIIYSDVRIIAATNKDLKKMVEQGTFREDLYYRLNIIPLTVPPLRERKDDIEALTRYFLGEFNQKYQKEVMISDRLIAKFREYKWPGNIRELRNEIERYVITDGDSGELFDSLVDVYSDNSAAAKDDVLAYGDTLREARGEFERIYIEKVLEECGGKVNKAAQRLGIHQSVLYGKLKKF